MALYTKFTSTVLRLSLRSTLVSMKKQGTAARRKPKKISPQPQPKVDQLQVGFTLRYTTTGIGSTPVVGVTFANLLDSWMVATGATTGFQLFDFIKIRRVTIRAVSNPGFASAVALAGPAVTVEVSYTGLVAGAQGSGKRVSDTAMGVNAVAMVSLQPGTDTLAGKWQPSSNDIAFVLRAQDFQGNPVVGAVIDVDVSLKNEPDVSPVAVSSPVAAAVAGNLYYRGIDGAAPAGTWAKSAFGPRI
jgi:hypothetical protein